MILWMEYDFRSLAGPPAKSGLGGSIGLEPGALRPRSHWRYQMKKIVNGIDKRVTRKFSVQFRVLWLW